MRCGLAPARVFQEAHHPLTLIFGVGDIYAARFGDPQEGVICAPRAKTTRGDHSCSSNTRAAVNEDSATIR